MNKFSYYQASTLEEALKKVNATVSSTIQPGDSSESAVLKAGGIDLLDLMKEGLSQPTLLVNIRQLEGMDAITMDDKSGLRIGANATLTAIARDEQIRTTYFALHQAAAKAATPQIRNMATLGGNLAQRTRCWYFRSRYHECYRKGSSTCFAQIGENRYHAIMNNADCASVHSSSLSTALMAFDAAVEVTGPDGKVKLVPLSGFFVGPETDRTTENILGPQEIITAVVLPKPKSSVRSQYLKMGERDSHDWPVADVAVAAEMDGARCKKANIVLGAAAPVPLLSEAAMKAIRGKEVNEENAMAAARAAMENATPLSQNAYKVPVFEAIIKRALLALT